MSTYNPFLTGGGFALQTPLTQSKFVLQSPSITDYPCVFNRQAIVSRSQLNLAILSKLPDVISAILPFAEQKNRRIRGADVTVYLDQEIDPLFPGAHVNPGYWIRNNWNALPSAGASVVRLYAGIRNIAEVFAEEALRTRLQLPDAASSAVNWKPQGWRWEKQPLTEPPINFFVDPPQQGGKIYFGATGLPVLKAIEARDWLGANIRYFSLWQRIGNPTAHWVEALPPGDLPIYTSWPLIPCNLRPIRMLPSEFDLRFSNLPGEESYFAVPGGAGSLARVDLTALTGRKVHFELLPDELAYTPGIIDALGRSKAAEATVSLVGEPGDFPIEQLREVADRLGHSFPLPTLPEPIMPDNALLTAGSPIPPSNNPRRMVLTPVIAEGGLGWLYAREKMGKTWFALAIAQAVSQGGSLGPWQAPEPASVLYIDGEMHPDDLDTAVAKVTRGQGNQATVSFDTLSAKKTKEGVINLMDPDRQKEIEYRAQGMRLVILDNFYSLTNNNVGEFPEVLNFLQRLQTQGIAILVVDHTNREGGLQGAHTKERAAETIIELRVPEGRHWREKIRAVEVTKSRHEISEISEYFTGTMVFTPDMFRFEVDMPEVPAEPEPLPKAIAKLAPIMIAHDIDTVLCSICH